MMVKPRRSYLDEEQSSVEERARRLREMLRFRRQDGWNLPKEPHTWAQSLGLSKCRKLNAQSLTSLARLTLMLPFDVAAVDHFVSQCGVIAADWHLKNRDTQQHQIWAKDNARSDDRQTLRLLREPEMSIHLRLDTSWHRLCSFIIHISSQLLDPDHDPDPTSMLVEIKSSNRFSFSSMNTFNRSLYLGPRDTAAMKWQESDSGSLEALVPAESASLRFEFFKEYVAQLQLWEQGENFAALKKEVQYHMDKLRLAMDDQYDAMIQEADGDELVQFHWEPMALGSGKPETCPQAICRQDHEEVMAIRVDTLSIVEMELQQQDAPLNGLLSPPLRRQLRRRRRSQDLTIDPPGGNRQSDGSVVPVPEPSPASLGPARATGPGEPPQGVSTAQLPAARDRPHLDILRACQNKALGQLSSIDERQFIHQLYLRATLLDRGFQQQVVAACSLQQSSRSGSPIQAKSREPSPASPGPAPLTPAGMASITVFSPGCDSETPRESERATSHLECARTASNSSTLLGNRLGETQVRSGSVKGIRRMTDKVNSYAVLHAEEAVKLCEHPSCIHEVPLTAHILDPVRASIICPNPSTILKTARWLIENSEQTGLPVVRVKNKFAVKDSLELDGYRDLMLSVLHTGERGLKIIGEIQLHDARMFPLKVKMHRLYKVKRATTALTVG